jgi:hypothetical protein
MGGVPFATAHLNEPVADHVEGELPANDKHKQHTRITVSTHSSVALSTEVAAAPSIMCCRRATEVLAETHDPHQRAVAQIQACQLLLPDRQQHSTPNHYWCSLRPL